MRQTPLKGHSGCTVSLMIPDRGGVFVRKVSKNPDYNERLERQCAKQSRYRSAYAMAPVVLGSGHVEDLYYFDMEYVRGAAVSSLVRGCTVDEVTLIADFLVNVIRQHKQTERLDDGAVAVIDAKIASLYDAMPTTREQEPIRSVFRFLRSHRWGAFTRSACHGDLTLENIIRTPRGEYYLIDFLDTFYESWIGDLSKVLQDLLVGWSFRDEVVRTTPTAENTKVRVLLLSRRFGSGIAAIIESERVWEDVYAYMLLDLVRLIPYIHDTLTMGFVIRSVEAMLLQIDRGGLYEHINRSMCWPIYAVPGSSA